jgi:hypothetical protein
VTWWQEGGNFGQPEVETIPWDDARYGEGAILIRIHSGFYAAKYFNYYRRQDGGFYQCVSGLQPGATVQFSAYGHGWSCDSDTPMGYTCADPWNQRFQVGIEPNGVADPFASSIVWSEETIAPDQYKLIGPTSAQVGEGGSACVFVRSKTEWMYKYADAYWDDASLVYTSPPAEPTDAAPPPPAAPAGPPPTPYPTPTPRPDGSIVHVVQSGETLFGISLKYNVPLDQIRQLNSSSLGSNDIIRPGQELVISLPSKTPIPTSPPEPTPAEVAEGGGDGGEEQPSQGGTAGASICVLSFHDRDGNLIRDAEIEDLLPNASFTLANDTGQIIGQYMSDAINEPHCFGGLAPGSYRLIQDPPPGYKPSGLSEQVVAVTEGTTVEVPFGSVRDENAGIADEGTADSVSSSGGGGEPSWLRSAFSTIFKVGGVLVLLACAGGVVLFVINQRRMAM